MRRLFPFSSARRRPARAGGVAALLAVLLIAALAAPAGAVDAPDPHAEQEAAHRLVQTLADELDRAAAAFEEARAQHTRLNTELAEAEDVAGTAEEQVAVAKAAFAARAAAAYRRPSTELALGQAVLEAHDSATAFHRVALVDVVRRRDDDVRRAEATDAYAAEQLRQRQIIDAGMASSTVELQRRADALAAAGTEARSRAAEAEAAVRALEERRLAAAQAAQAAEAARTAAAARAAPSTPLPASATPEGALACPVGLPHGFIDSWGYPRSGGRSHQGVDIFAARGTPLYAVADGTIQRVGNDRLGGLVIHLLDDSGHRYYYAHLDAVAVSTGQRVRAGDVVGTVGTTGNARTTPPHLHWQYHPGNGPPVNPYFLARALCRG